MSARRNGLTVVIGGAQPWSPGQDPRQDVTSVASRANLDWQERGLCHGTDPELYFPPQGENPHQARAVCERCPVRKICLGWALSIEDGHPTSVHGVFGGMTPDERAVILRKRLEAKRQARAA